MKQAIVSIANKNYIQYAIGLFRTLREAGWAGECVLFSEEDNIYCNETVKTIDQKIHSEFLPDNRWLMLELFDRCQEFDRVLYMDADCIVNPCFPWQKMLESDLYMGYLDTPDNPVTIRNMKQMECILGYKPDREYILTPFVFSNDDKSKRFFELSRDCARDAISVDSGIVTTFTLAVEKFKDEGHTIDLMPEDHMRCTLELERDDPWFTHYAGKLGKQLWDKEWIIGEKYDRRV